MKEFCCTLSRSKQVSPSLSLIAKLHLPDLSRHRVTSNWPEYKDLWSEVYPDSESCIFTSQPKSISIWTTLKCWLITAWCNRVFPFRVWFKFVLFLSESTDFKESKSFWNSKSKGLFMNWFVVDALIEILDRFLSHF